jgi:hypothetical protein
MSLISPKNHLGRPAAHPHGQPEHSQPAAVLPRRRRELGSLPEELERRSFEVDIRFATTPAFAKNCGGGALRS